MKASHAGIYLALAALSLAGATLEGQGRGNGRGKNKGDSHDVSGGARTEIHVVFSTQDVAVIREHYSTQPRNLPPGLQKKYRADGQAAPGLAEEDDADAGGRRAPPAAAADRISPRRLRGSRRDLQAGRPDHRRDGNLRRGDVYGQYSANILLISSKLSVLVSASISSTRAFCGDRLSAGIAPSWSSSACSPNKGRHPAVTSAAGAHDDELRVGGRRAQ